MPECPLCFKILKKSWKHKGHSGNTKGWKHNGHGTVYDKLQPVSGTLPRPFGGAHSQRGYTVVVNKHINSDKGLDAVNAFSV